MSSLQGFKISKFQFFPPFQNAKDFEEFVSALFNAIENTTSYNLFGKTGQPQFGLDVYSIEKLTVIQCKCVDIRRQPKSTRRDLLKDLKNDFEAFTKYNDSIGGKFKRFIFITTWDDDTHLAEQCIRLSSDNQNVEYWSWNTILRHLSSEIIEGPLSDFYGILMEFNQGYFGSTDSQSQSFSVNQAILHQSSDVVLDRTKPLLDQLFDFISIKFKEINNIPVHILTKGYPFKVNESFYPYYSSFCLTTDNEELFEFFDSIKIGQGGSLVFNKEKFIRNVDDYENKTKFILRKLTANLIFDLESKKSARQIPIGYFNQTKCDCIKCRFFRFDFSGAFKMLDYNPISIEDKFRLAITNYHIGNFLTAGKLLTEIIKEYENQKSSFYYFLALFNLVKLKVFIKYQYFNDKAAKGLMEYARQIELDEWYVEHSRQEDKEILDWIKSGSFYSESRDKIQKTVSKIRDIYDNFKRGGWNSNNLILPLQNQYAEIEAFIRHNYLVYDAFTEFEDLSDIFIEGLFAAHAIKNTSGVTLRAFDDWLIAKIIYYGKPERITLFFSRYNLTELKYMPTSTDGDSFLEMLLRFLKNSAETKEAFGEFCEKENWYFWQKYKLYLNNMMVLAALFDLEKEQINRIVNALIEFLEAEKSPYQSNVNFIKIFIARQGRKISFSNLKKLLFFILDNGYLHEADILEITIKKIKKHHKGLALTRDDVNRFMDLAFERCPQCSHPHSPLFIIYLYKSLENSELQVVLKKGILNYLNSNFHAELFYAAVLENVIKLEEKFFNLFINAVKPKPNATSLKKLFTGRDDDRFLGVSQLLDICFKFDLDLQDKRFIELSNLDLYYQWLFNLKTFDYDQFDPKWITEHKTNQYFREFKKHKEIMKRTCQYLKKNPDPHVEKVFAHISCIKEDF